jgi:hypothetical protein
MTGYSEVMHLGGKRAIHLSATATWPTSTAQEASSICTLKSASDHPESSLTRANTLRTKQ